MALINEFETTGNWLFKRRSFLPLIIVPFLFYCLLTPVNNLYYILFYTGLMVSLLGECIRIFTIAFVPAGTSGRNTKQQLATSLNQTGIYSTVRHPLYLGNFFMFLGPFLFTGNIYGIIILILAFWIYYERIMFAEEAYLIKLFGHEYEKWSLKTPAVIPNIFLYSPPNAKFSFKKVLEREYTGICGVFIIFTILLAFRNYHFNFHPIISDNWAIIFIGNIFVYLILRTLKKIDRRKSK
ncbi:MAG: lipid A phosphate methyltransferase [Candidatus Marinimicrobia bacterium]|nr:lipid A phosphate methyltransferase [Candidatus Neomarinimicrobiota bacterium]